MSQLSLQRHVPSSRPRLVFFVGATDAVDQSTATLADRADVAVRVVRGERCRTKISLLREWAAALQFPSYFGENWDAFDECMRDLSWLRRNRCIVYVTDFDQVLPRNRGEFNTLLSILRDAAIPTSDREGLKVAFILHCPASREQNLRARLAQAPIGPDDADWIRTLAPSVALGVVDLLK